MKHFEDLQLMPGASVQLLISGSDQKNYSLDTVYMGTLALHSLLVAMPSAHPSVVWRSGMKLAMSVVVPNGIATFNSRIDAIGERPYRYMHLSYPPEINFREIRGAARVKVELPVSVAGPQAISDPKDFVSNILDISVSGLKLATNKPIGSIGDQLTIHIAMHFANEERQLSVKGVIKALLAGGGSDTQLSNVYGVQFLPLSDDQQVLLHAFVLNGLQAGSKSNHQ